MTNEFCFEYQGGGKEGGTCEVLRPCHPQKFGTCTFTTMADLPALVKADLVTFELI